MVEPADLLGELQGRPDQVGEIGVHVVDVLVEVLQGVGEIRGEFVFVVSVAVE